MAGVGLLQGSTGAGSAVKLGAHLMLLLQGRSMRCPAAGQGVLTGVM